MKTLQIVPDGWETSIEECRPGYFVAGTQLCLKSEYGGLEAFNEAGEYFCPRKVTVQPVTTVWVEEEI